MRFPQELFEDERERQLVMDLLAAFEEEPLILTDKLANSIYLTDEAARLLGDRPDALVNRLAFSLLGYGKQDRVPTALAEALDGTSGAWRGIVPLDGDRAEGEFFLAQISAIRSEGRLLCGVIKLSAQPVSYDTGRGSA